MGFRALEGVLMAAAATFGWALWARTDDVNAIRFVQAEPFAYAALLVAVLGMFAFFGMALESRERDLVGKNNELEGASLTDAVTGLPNRRYFDIRLSAEMAVSHRTGEPFAVGILDLDCFKLVNDSLGHPVGDALLRAVSAAMSDALRRGETLARIGGDEFAVLLLGADTSEAARACERIRLAGSNARFEAAGCPVGSTLTAGVASTSEFPAGCASGQLYAAADTELYEGKRAGRNCTAVYRGASDTRWWERPTSPTEEVLKGRSGNPQVPPRALR